MDRTDGEQDELAAAAVQENEEDEAETAPTLEEAVIKRRLVDMLEKPNQRYVDSLVLQRSSRRATNVTHMEIINKNTGEIHHHAIKLEVIHSVAKSKGGGWSLRAPVSIWIDDDGHDAIGKLRDFLSVARDDLPNEVGDFLLVRLDGEEIAPETVRRLIGAASTRGKAEALVEAVEAVSGDPDALDHLAELASAHPDASKVAAAALNLARYADALTELERLINLNADESEFQSLLTKNAWIFGSEYSELHPRRVWVRDQQKDFMLRRAADGYLEIIEIKTPLGANERLFLWDDSHDCFYSRSELTKVVAQVMSYIEGVDTDRANIFMKDNERVNKIVARIIIGRDHDQQQVDALRQFNSHQERIEVLTFDQLLRIGRRVVEHVQQVVKPLQEGDESQVIGEPPQEASARVE